MLSVDGYSLQVKITFLFFFFFFLFLTRSIFLFQDAATLHQVAFASGILSLFGRSDGSCILVFSFFVFLFFFSFFLSVFSFLSSFSALIINAWSSMGRGRGFTSAIVFLALVHFGSVS